MVGDRQWLTIELAKTADGSKAKTGATIVQLNPTSKDVKSDSGKKGQKNKSEEAVEQPTPKRLKTNSSAAAAASASAAAPAAADVEEIVQQGQNPDDY